MSETKPVRTVGNTVNTYSSAIAGLPYTVDNPPLNRPAMPRDAATSEPMTLERAVQVLNGQEHNGRTNWQPEDIWGGLISTCVDSFDPEEQYQLSEFEAIAVAEKYLREAK